MLIKTTELAGQALDWAVATCKKPEWLGNQAETYVTKCGFSPSINWAQGGPIIENEICRLEDITNGLWQAEAWGLIVEGPTALVAAMRCYVANKLGDEVDVPPGLKNEMPEVTSGAPMAFELLSALIGAEKCIVKSLPYLPADKEAVYCGEWLVEIREAIANATGKAPYPTSGITT